MARFGPPAGKTQSTAATPPKFRSFYPLEFFGLIHKRPGYDPFFAENPFSPADEFVFMGLVVRSCHFDVTACAEARRLAQRAERPLRGLSALWASRRASRAGWKKKKRGFRKRIRLSGSGSEQQELDLDWCKTETAGAPSTIGLTIGPLLAALLSGTHMS